jgi:hypothetical protein
MELNHGPKILWTETSGHKTHGFQLAIINGLKHPFKQEKSAAGKKWFRSFLKRLPELSLRSPDGISAARVKSFTSENVVFFYESELRKVRKPPGYSVLMQQELQQCNRGTVKLSA